jgi:DNA (cytosine-5)-methyltransferase 1
VRMDDGLSAELDFVGARDNRTARLKALGNAIVPQVAYQIFQAIQQTYQP